MELLQSVWDYMKAASPFLLFGLILSGIIKVFLSSESIIKYLGPGSRWSVLKASLVGVPLPLCSCSVIPTAVTLKKKGASNGATSSFLISTPESGVDSIMLTYALIDIPMTIIRPIAAFCTAMVAGILQNLFNDNDSSLATELEESACCHNEKSIEKDIKKELSLPMKFLNGLKFAFDDLICDISLWLTIGIILGALISYLVPSHFFEGLSGIEGRLAILLIGVPLYICASASTPIAASLMMKGLSPGMALLFLLVGPATNLSNILVLQKYLGRKGVLINILAIVLMALVFSFTLDWAYGYFEWELVVKEGMDSHDHSFWSEQFRSITAIILTCLLLRGIVKKYLIKS